MSTPVRNGFTLIELLVVVTIIVVLLALLVPAMDRAIYQTELAVCGTRLKGLAGGVMLYAMENQKRYPTPRTNVSRSHTVITQWDVNNPVNPNWDIRPLVKGYVSINGHFNDPLSPEVDYEGSKQDGSMAFTGNFAAYSVLWDWRWDGYGTSEKGMYRLGDRLTWTQADGLVRKFSLLAADWSEDSVAAFVMGSHPDRAGLMTAQSAQDASPPWWTAPAGQNTTVTLWWRPDSDERGFIDRNFAHDDGSVRRVSDQDWGEGPPGRGPGDGRMVLVPAFNNTRQDLWPARKIYLPKE